MYLYISIFNNWKMLYSNKYFNITYVPFLYVNYYKNKKLQLLTLSRANFTSSLCCCLLTQVWVPRAYFHNLILAHLNSPTALIEENNTSVETSAADLPKFWAHFSTLV